MSHAALPLAQSNAGLQDDAISESVRSVHDATKKKKKKEKRKKLPGQKTHKHKRRTRKDSVYLAYDMVDNVVHVILSDEVQKLLKCVVGEEVTAEKPWTYVNKFFIQEQVESEDVPVEFHTFLPHKQFVCDFPNDYMMIGYIPDESRDYDEYYFCLTVEAEEACTEMTKLQEARQLARLENTINKRVGSWETLGSEAEIEEGWMKKTRGYYMVEFEARYPVMYPDVKFRYRMVSQARDGYLELKTMSRYLVLNINRKRIDNGTQVAPSVNDNFAQTFCSYPQNAWTQYEYECKFVEHITKDFMETFRNFTSLRMDEFHDMMRVNEDINFYSNDYVELRNAEIPLLFEGLYLEYQSFDDVKRCKDKMISAISWHPMWTGVIAIAYANISPKWYNTENRDTNMMEEIVHGYNPILIWSFNDSLNPKLILESNSEVHCLSFCPQDPNLLIGGCANGQIILWDIKNKLNKVETEEVLTSAQQLYRTRLFSEMGWMKNTRDYSIVPPTAFSQLLFSHMNNVTAIEWIPPLYSVERTGHIDPLKNSDEPSLQFLTSSADGTIKFWDLKQKPVITGDYKPQRKSRRLGRRPSALTMDVSPYRILNRRLLPHYELEVCMPNSERLCPVSSIQMPCEKMTYEEANLDVSRSANMTDRIIYEPIYKWPRKPVESLISIGTYTGNFIIASWEGYEYSSGDVYAKEIAKFLNFGKYHDGPVLTIMRHPIIEDAFLSIGGKIFCIWLGRLKGQPVMWRRSRNKYTHGHWESKKCSSFRFTTSDGSRELWNLEYKSDSPYSSQMYSGKPLLEGWPHRLPMKQDIVGIADDRGTLRLVCTDNDIGDDDEAVRTFAVFLENNADRKVAFEEWQTNWTDKHAGWIKAQYEAELAEQARLRAEELDRQAFDEEMRAKEAIEAAKREAAMQHPPAGKYEEWARERWIVKEQERMGNELLSNKRLDKETLMKQQLPLKKLEIEAARKQQKIKQRLMKVDEIFTETVAMLFPNLAEREPEDPFGTVKYTEDEVVTMRDQFITAYNDVKAECKEIIEKNPFVYELDWKCILASSKARKLKDEFKFIQRHTDRHKRDKIKRDASDVFEDYSRSFKTRKLHSLILDEEYEEEEELEDEIL